MVGRVGRGRQAGSFGGDCRYNAGMHRFHFSTNSKLWVACTIVTYMALMATPLSGKFEGRSMGLYWVLLYTEPSPPLLAIVFVYLVCVFGSIAIVIGWVFHAILLVATDALLAAYRRLRGRNPAPQDF